MSVAAQNDPLYQLSTLIETGTWQKPFSAMSVIVQAGMQEISALRRFKAYVHERLDQAGIPTHPDGPHSAAGCRVGDRLDLVIERADRVAELEEELDEAKQQPWPEWAEKLLRILEEYGCEYEADDEVDLPSELAEWLNGYASDLKRVAASKLPPQPKAD